jgi:hypothetical protein
LDATVLLVAVSASGETETEDGLKCGREGVLRGIQYTVCKGLSILPYAAACGDQFENAYLYQNFYISRYVTSLVVSFDLCNQEIFGKLSSTFDVIGNSCTVKP